MIHIENSHDSDFIRGPELFKKLQTARKNIRHAIAKLAIEAKEVDGKMQQLVALRGQEFIDLSKLYLPELSTTTVQSAFKHIQTELKDLLQQKQNFESQLEQQIGLAIQTTEEAQNELEKTTELLNEKANERDHLQEVVAKLLKQNTEYEELTNQAAQAEKRLTQNEERMAQVHNEAAQKLPSYDSSRLFRYLYDRKFGTPDYRATGMTRTIDRWLAKFIGFRKAKRSYDFMKTTPTLMAAELKRRQDQFNELMDLIEKMEQATEHEVGLTVVIAKGDELGAKRDELLNQIEAQIKIADESKLELHQSLDSKGVHYEQALASMRDQIENSEVDQLIRHARSTQKPTDDKIVENIASINRLIDELQPDILQLNGKRKSLVDRQSGMEDVIRQFRASNFDSRRSVFPRHIRLEQMVERFSTNDIDSRSLWKHIKQNQRFQQSWAQQTATDVINDPSAQVVLHTMLDLAAEALKQSARRSVYRRNSGRSGGLSWPRSSRSTGNNRRRSSRRSRPRRRSNGRRGGFTTGDGF
ncbi:MAG: hypothetical protein AAGA30_04395 [Planctomycetota bacterium]